MRLLNWGPYSSIINAQRVAPFIFLFSSPPLFFLQCLDTWSNRAWEVITFSWHSARWLAGSTGRKRKAPPSACELSCVGLGLVWSQHRPCWSWSWWILLDPEQKLSTVWASTSSAALMCSQESVNKTCARIRRLRLLKFMFNHGLLGVYV